MHSFKSNFYLVLFLVLAYLTTTTFSTAPHRRGNQSETSKLGKMLPNDSYRFPKHTALTKSSYSSTSSPSEIPTTEVAYSRPVTNSQDSWNETRILEFYKDLPPADDFDRQGIIIDLDEEDEKMSAKQATTETTTTTGVSTTRIADKPTFMTNNTTAEVGDRQGYQVSRASSSMHVSIVFACLLELSIMVFFFHDPLTPPWIDIAFN